MVRRGRHKILRAPLEVMPLTGPATQYTIIMTKSEGKYIYCIINEKREQRFNFVGIDDREVKSVLYKDIGAVVSDAPVINFDSLGKGELMKYVAAHQKVNEEVAKNYDVVPMAFGIIAPRIEEVTRILGKAYLQFKTALRKIAGKTEFVVQIWWDQKRILEGLAHSDPEIQELSKEASSKTGVLAIPVKLMLGKLIHQRIGMYRESCINEINAFLGELVCDHTLNKLIDEEMIANFSFLIEKAKEPELDKKMQKIGAKYQDELRFKYIGPAPPYSFCIINLRSGNFEVVEEARRLLGLPEEASFEEIRRAYYVLSHRHHPDTVHGDEQEMKKINQSFSVLENYCVSYDTFTGKPKIGKYSFRRKNIEDSIMLS